MNTDNKYSKKHRWHSRAELLKNGIVIRDISVVAEPLDKWTFIEEQVEQHYSSEFLDSLVQVLHEKE